MHSATQPPLLSNGLRHVTEFKVMTPIEELKDGLEKQVWTINASRT